MFERNEVKYQEAFNLIQEKLFKMEHEKSTLKIQKEHIRETRSEDYTCDICLDIVEKPQQCKSCENLFCSDCLV